MPELPEVEFTARQLRATIIGGSIRAVQVFWPRTIGYPDLPQFLAQITGLHVVGVRRRAKYILLDLASQPDNQPEFLLTLHRRMTGNLYLLPSGWLIDTSLREADPVLWNVKGPLFVPPVGMNSLAPTHPLVSAQPHISVEMRESASVNGQDASEEKDVLARVPTEEGGAIDRTRQRPEVAEKVAMAAQNVLASDPAELRYCRVCFDFADGRRLLFTDQRKFGRIKLWPIEQEAVALEGLGPEPLDAAFTVELLAQRLASHKGPIKTVLLAQEVVAGLGNIYADEALFYASIHPLRPANSLTPAELQKLHAGITSVLAMSIQYGGTTFSGYRGLQGEVGANYDHLQVYHRIHEEKRCPRCGELVVRLVVAQRSAHFCPHCQQTSTELIAE